MNSLFGILNAATSAVLVAMLAYQLLTKHRSFTTCGRHGAALAAAGALMAGAAWAHPGSPFDGWSAILMRIGFGLILIDWFGWWGRGKKT